MFTYLMRMGICVIAAFKGWATMARFTRSAAWRMMRDCCKTRETKLLPDIGSNLSRIFTLVK